MPVEPLQRDATHVWMIERDHQADLAQLAECLSPEEQQQARRFKVVQRRDFFVYNRAMLRQILARHADLEPRQVPLTVTASGKPVWDAARQKLHFNLTHHQDLAIVAVSHQRTVGIDVESIDPRADYLALAQQVLSASELRRFEQLSAAERPAAMLRAWTRKEAFLKAVGIGLARPLAEIEVSFVRTEYPQILATGDPREPASAWLLECWSPRPGWFAALATPRESGGVASAVSSLRVAPGLARGNARRDKTPGIDVPGNGEATCGMNIVGSFWRGVCGERLARLPDHRSVLTARG